jgi:hypothetical protein
VIEETCDVEFDESNGSQGDGFCCDDVGKEPLREAMKKMALGTSSQRRMMILTPFMKIPPPPMMMMMTMVINQGMQHHPPQEKIVYLPHKNHLPYHKTLKIK